MTCFYCLSLKKGDRSSYTRQMPRVPSKKTASEGNSLSLSAFPPTTTSLDPVSVLFFLDEGLSVIRGVGDEVTLGDDDADGVGFDGVKVRFRLRVKV